MSLEKPEFPDYSTIPVIDPIRDQEIFLERARILATNELLLPREDVTRLEEEFYINDTSAEKEFLKDEIAGYFKKFDSVGSYRNIVSRYDGLRVRNLPENLETLIDISKKMSVLKRSNPADYVIIFNASGDSLYEAMNRTNVDWSTVNISPAKKYADLTRRSKVNTYGGSGK